MKILTVYILYELHRLFPSLLWIWTSKQGSVEMCLPAFSSPRTRSCAGSNVSFGLMVHGEALDLIYDNNLGDATLNTRQLHYEGALHMCHHDHGNETAHFLLNGFRRCELADISADDQTHRHGSLGHTGDRSTHRDRLQRHQGLLSSLMRSLEFVEHPIFPRCCCWTRSRYTRNSCPSCTPSSASVRC